MKDIIIPNTLTLGSRCKDCGVGAVDKCCPGTKDSLTDRDCDC